MAFNKNAVGLDEKTRRFVIHKSSMKRQNKSYDYQNNNERSAINQQISKKVRQESVEAN